MEKHVNGLEWRDVNRLAALPVIEIGPSFISKIVKVVHHWRWGLLMELRGGEGIGVECVCGFSQWRGPLYRSLSEQINSDAYDQVAGERERVCPKPRGREGTAWWEVWKSSLASRYRRALWCAGFPPVRDHFLYRCLIRPVEDTRAGGNADHPSQRPGGVVWCVVSHHAGSTFRGLCVVVGEHASPIASTYTKVRWGLATHARMAGVSLRGCRTLRLVGPAPCGPPEVVGPG